MVKKDLSLYFHLPFCKKKCPYCHFYVILDHEGKKDLLLKALIQELKLLPIKDNPIVSVYFGGGTPSLFSAHRIKILLQHIPNLLPQAEITLELNPEKESLTCLREYKKVGINRLSVGVQSFSDALLKKIGRLHTAQDAIDVIAFASKIGFENITIDLMYDLPGQTLALWKESLDIAKTLPITHLSLYNMTIEPGTVFFKKKKEVEKELPNEKISALMYEMAIDKLTKAHFDHYEISAFAKKGFIAVHNSRYWKGLPFFGLGPSAFSYYQGKRFCNVAHFNKYCQNLLEDKLPISYEEKLCKSQKLKELLIIGLRLSSGVDLETFQKEHGYLSSKDLQTLSLLTKKGFLKRRDKIIFLTRKGKLFYDTVAVELI